MLARERSHGTDRCRGGPITSSPWLRLVLPLTIASVALVARLNGACAGGEPPALAAVANDQASQQALIETARERNAQLPDACASATFTDTGHLVALSQPRADSTGKLTGGAWQQSVIAAGCGAQRQLNILTLAQPDGTLRRISLLPGTTIADPYLQRDAIQYAMIGAARLMARHCHRATIVETRFAEFEGGPVTTVPPARVARPWREDWTVDGCGERAVVPMHFIPDPTGTTIHVSPNEVRPG